MGREIVFEIGSRPIIMGGCFTPGYDDGVRVDVGNPGDLLEEILRPVGRNGRAFFCVSQGSLKGRNTIGEFNAMVVINKEHTKTSGPCNFHQLLNGMGTITECGSKIYEARYRLVGCF